MLIITTLKLQSEIYFLTSIFSPPSGLQTLWGFRLLLCCWHRSFLSGAGVGGPETFPLGKNITPLTRQPCFLFFLLIRVILCYSTVLRWLNSHFHIHSYIYTLECWSVRSRCMLMPVTCRAIATCLTWSRDCSRCHTYLHGALGPLASIKLGRKLYPQFIVWLMFSFPYKMIRIFFAKEDSCDKELTSGFTNLDNNLLIALFSSPTV